LTDTTCNDAFENIIDFIAEGVLILDQNGTIILANRATEKIFGFTGQRLTDFLQRSLGRGESKTDQLPSAIGEAFSRVIKSASPVYDLHYHYVRPDSVPRDIVINVFPLLNDKGDGNRVVLLLKDIGAEQSAAEASLLESNQTLAAIFEASPVAIIATDLYNSVTAWNPGAERMFGWQAGEVLGRKLPIVSENRGNEFKALRDRVLHGTTVIEIEVQGQRKDGSLIAVSISSAPLYNAEGKITGIMTVTLDITTRKKQELALKQSEANYRAIFDAVNDAIFVHDTSTADIIDVNRRASEMYSYPTHELRRLSLIDISSAVPPFTPEAALEWVRRAAQEGPQIFEWLAKDRFGRLFWVEVNLKRAVIGGIPRILAVVRDINDRKLLEEEREELSRRIQLLLDSTDEGIFGIDLDGLCNLINRAAAEMTGYTQDEILGKNVHDLFHYKHPNGTPYPAYQCPIYSSYKEGVGVHIDTEVFWRKDGSPFFVEYTSNPIMEEGRIAGAVVTFSDIAKRKNAEMALRESEARYRSLFEDAPVSLWEEDFSAIKAYLDDLRQQGITDFESYFGAHPEEIDRVASLVKVNDANRATVELYRATDKNELERNITDTFTNDMLATFKDELVAIANGETTFEREVTNTTLDGQTIFVVSKFFVPDEYANTLSKVFISVVDITERKLVEEQQRAAGELSESLNAINAVIGSTLDFDEIMRLVVVDASKALDADSASIALYEKDRWIIGYLYGFSDEHVGKPLGPEETKQAQMVVAAKAPTIISDAFTDTRVDNILMRAHGVRSILALPLTVREEVIGVLRFAFTSKQVDFSEIQVDFANKLAIAVSLAIENARLYAVERNIADTLQAALLTTPERIPGVDFSHLYRSASIAAKVGGDFYEIFELEHNKAGIIVGDVSGKGLGAATLTSLVKSTIKAYAYEDGQPASALEKTNPVIARAVTPTSFVTMFFGILDIETGKLIYCSAGHPPGIIKRKSGDVVVLETESPLIGAFADMHYTNSEVHVDKGDIIICYTDGITEARCNSGFFGEERLLQIIRIMDAVSPHSTITNIFNAVLECTGGRLSDDIALIAVARDTA
jgi:PAS domain S-box-containing protein